MEIGMGACLFLLLSLLSPYVSTGIHNEPGFARIRPIPSSAEVIEKMMTILTMTDDPERSYLPLKGDEHDEVVLLVNNLGGLSELELGSVANDALLWIEKKSRLSVKRALIGTFMVRTT
jgi:triose/dihydroxyacetone kinase / FAD-AMP lyase (cyclizing)